MMFLLTITSVIIFLLVGFVVIEFFELLNQESLLAKLSYSWGLGVGFIAFQLFIYSNLRIPWNLLNILIPWIILFALFLLRRKKFHKLNIKTNLSHIEKIFAFLIIVLLIFTCIEALLRPVAAWDGWDNWILRPKVFYIQNNLSLDYVNYTHDEYPLVIPLMGTFDYLLMKGINDTYILLLFFMFYLTLGGLFFAFCKKELGAKKALILTFLLLSLQNIIRHGGRFEVGQADLALGYYLFACTTLLLNFLKKRTIKTLLLLSIFLGISTQIKNDGIPFFIITNTFLIVIIGLKKQFSYFWGLLPSFIIFFSWVIYKNLNHYPQNFLLTNGLHPQVNKIVPIFLAMAKEFINFQNWSILWIVFFATIIVCRKYLSQIKLLLMLFLFQWFSYFAAFMLTSRDPVREVENVIDKLYIHLAAIAVLIIGILINYQFPKLKKNQFRGNILNNILKSIFL